MSFHSPSTNPAEWISTLISEFIRISPGNTLKNEENTKAWDDPLVGFSRGDDPLYREFQKTIGEYYLIPQEIISFEYPGHTIKPSEITVICWILPHTKETKEGMRKEQRYPSEAWARARVFGEETNNALRSYLVDHLKQEGFLASAPVLSPLWKVQTNNGYIDSSNWSERHAAYASGLGTFGLSDGLITVKGKAMRCGSVVTTLKIPATIKPYSSRNDYCPHLSGGSCGLCMKRCPAGAITQSGHDKEKCATFLTSVTTPYIGEMYGFSGHACGLCQTKVPCESKIPSQKKNGESEDLTT